MDSGKIAGLYDLGETLGRGHYAVVKQARHVFTGEQVAVKVIDKTKLDQVSRAHLFQEVRCMKLVQHPHVVRLYEVIDTQTKLYLILEFGDGGDMYDHIMRHDNGVSEEHARRYFGQILSAIIYCHKLHVVHRDLKPENVVFFDKLGVVKLTDFGFSNKFLPGEKLETSCGSLAYSAPEILLGDSYDAPKVDIWSLGVLLYMLVVGRAPFQEANDSETLTMIMDCKYYVPGHVSQQCKSLIGKMLVRSPEKRATLEQIADDEWLRGLDVGQLVAGPLVSREQLSEEDHQLIVHKMVQGNIASKEQIHEALEENTYDHITATYYLLAERKLRSTRFGVKTPARGRKQMLAQPPRVAPGVLQLTTGSGTTTGSVTLGTTIGVGSIAATTTVGHAATTTTTTTTTAPMITTIPATITSPAAAAGATTASTLPTTVTGGLPLNSNCLDGASHDNSLSQRLGGNSISSYSNNNSSLTTTSSGPHDALTVPSRLARKCSIVREGEEDEPSTSPRPPFKTLLSSSTAKATSPAKVRVEEVLSPLSDQDTSSLSFASSQQTQSQVSPNSGEVGGVGQTVSLPTTKTTPGAGAAGSASQQYLCPNSSSDGHSVGVSEDNGQLSPAAGQPVGRKLHAVKSSPQLLQSTQAASAAAAAVAGGPSSVGGVSGFGLALGGAPATARGTAMRVSGSCASAAGSVLAPGQQVLPIAGAGRPLVAGSASVVVVGGGGGHSHGVAAPRHRRLSCSSSENDDDDDEDPTFRRLERSKQEEDTEMEGRRRDSIAAQINRERRASALSVAVTPPMATPETENLPALNLLSNLVRHDSVQFMDKSDSSSLHGAPSSNAESARESVVVTRSDCRKVERLIVAAEPRSDTLRRGTTSPVAHSITQSKSLDASMGKSICASISVGGTSASHTNNNNNNNNNNNHSNNNNHNNNSNHHHHQPQQQQQQHHGGAGGKSRTKRLVDVKLASKCCSIC